MLLRLLPFLLMIGYAVVAWQLSVRRTKAELDARSVALADPALDAVFARLAQAAGVRAITVRLYEIDPVNGLAAPDGRIFLTRGFYRRFQAGDVTAEELASVVAHEMGHVALGHMRRRMIDFTGQNVVRMVLGAVLSRLLPGFGGWLASGLTALLASRLSRDDEYAADAYASALMVKAGLGMAPQKRLLARLGALAGHGSSPPAWLMSHPRTEDRVAAIEANERKWGVAG